MFLTQLVSVAGRYHQMMEGYFAVDAKHWHTIY